MAINSVFKQLNLVINQPKEKETQEAISYFKSLLDIIDEKSENNNYFAIIHDKDIDENGEPKRTHLHVVYIATTPTTLANWLNYFSDLLSIPTNCISIESIKSLPKAVQYLTHQNQKKKTQYLKSEVITNDKKLYQNMTLTEEEIERAIFTESDILNLTNAIGLDNTKKYLSIFKERNRESEHLILKHKNINALNYCMDLLENDKYLSQSKTDILEKLIDLLR